MGMSEFYGPSDEQESVATIHRALDLGVTFLDTSDMYGAGHNERLVGKAIAGRRDEVQLATKFAIRRADGKRWIDNSPEWVREAVEGSLQRLGVEQIDLYYMHRRNPDVPIEESVGAMAELIEQGKVAHIGLSEVNAETLRAACAVHPITALQSEWSLFTRGLEAEIVPAARELGVGDRPLQPARPWRADRVRRHQRRRRLPAQLAALPGGQPRAQPGAGRALQGDRRGVGPHARSAGAGLAAAPGRRRRADPGHAQGQPRGGERRRRRHRAQRRASWRRSRSCSHLASRRATATPTWRRSSSDALHRAWQERAQCLADLLRHLAVRRRLGSHRPRRRDRGRPRGARRGRDVLRHGPGLRLRRLGGAAGRGARRRHPP